MEISYDILWGLSIEPLKNLLIYATGFYTFMVMTTIDTSWVHGVTSRSFAGKVMSQFIQPKFWYCAGAVPEFKFNGPPRSIFLLFQQHRSGL
jgi:hypothetical protein